MSILLTHHRFCALLYTLAGTLLYILPSFKERRWCRIMSSHSHEPSAAVSLLSDEN
jgi:hypothetical protein